MHYPQRRLTRHHRNRGLPTLPGSGHTHTLLTPLSGRTQATKQHGNKYRPTIPTNSSPPTCPEFGSTSRRLEAGRQSQHGDFHPNRDQLQHSKTTNPTIRPYTSGPKVNPKHHQVHRHTPKNLDSPQGGWGVEHVVENCPAGTIPRHSTSTDSASVMRRGHMLPQGRVSTNFVHFGSLPLINSRTTNIAYPGHLNLRAAPDGAYIISHAKKNRSS